MQAASYFHLEVFIAPWLHRKPSILVKQICVAEAVTLDYTAKWCPRASLSAAPSQLTLPQNLRKNQAFSYLDTSITLLKQRNEHKFKRPHLHSPNLCLRWEIVRGSVYFFLLLLSWLVLVIFSSFRILVLEPHDH